MQNNHYKESYLGTPLISFIIPCYNMPFSFIERCIQSILDTKLAPCQREIILVDDGSTMPLTTIQHKYGNDVHCLRQTHAGLGAARNYGMENASGEYIQFVDADDLLDSDEYNSCIEKIKDGTLDVLVFSMKRNKKALKWHSIHHNVEELFNSGVEYMAQHNIQGSPWSLLFKKVLVKGIRFPVNVIHEDEGFIPLVLLEAQTTLLCAINPYIYTQRANSIMNRVSKEHSQKRISDFLCILIDLNLKVGKYEGVQNKALKRRIAQLTMDSIYNAIKLLHSRKCLYQHIQLLEKNRLYPLPTDGYTWKYSLFTLFANNRIGLYLLYTLLS